MAIVGGGTAGLSSAAELMRLKVGKVVVLEREAEAGGIPRHCGHYPFGLREYGLLMRGPDYARRNRDTAVSLGADIRTGTTVIKLDPGGKLSLTTDAGTATLSAERVVLCTGIRESSRAQRFISGDRPSGVISTGALQSMVYLKGIKPFERPVIFGSELISLSAIQTCRHLKIKPVAMVEEQDRMVARQALRLYPVLTRTPVFTGIANPRIIGRERVEALEFADRTGQIRRIKTDGIVVSGHFRPESQLLRDSHLEVDPGTGGPIIDQFGRCSDLTYFSTGNLLRPAETACFCWREGIETARRVSSDLMRKGVNQTDFTQIVPSDPALRFVVPQRIDVSSEPGGMERMYLGLNRPVRGSIIAESGKQTLWSGYLKSRPVRRVQLPLEDIINAVPKDTVKISTG